jgi:FKBP-type peptidyl-prolyl cis-trans isomerase FklB
MLNSLTCCKKPILLAVSIAAGTILSFGQTNTAPSSPAATKKSTATSTAKTGTAAKTGTSPKTTPKADASTAPLSLTSDKDKTSYSIGVDLGNKLKSQSIDVDTGILMRGMKDGMSGAKPLMSDDDMHAALNALSAQIRQKQTAMLKDMADKNKSEGDTFLAENKTKEGVVALPSGLQYKVLKAGDGPKPTAADSVVCNYKGTLISGKEFDSSYKRGQPATFPVGGVIKGWTEALQLMPVGSKWQLFIPPDLAYGERGAGADIQPDSTLIFEVELMSIAPKNQGSDKAPDAQPDKK